MTNKTQQEQEAAGDKDLTPATGKEKTLSICNEIVRAYKKLIVLDEADTEKLAREMTKCFVSASAIISRLNRAK